jgi:hypothetical protein
MVKELYTEYFDESHLDNYSIDDIKKPSTGISSTEPEEWSFVRARTMSRGVGLYSEGLCRVLSVTSGSPLTDSTEVISTDEVLDRMPKGPKERKSVPSLKGDYLTVKEVRPEENEDGTVEPRTKGRTSVIPIEFVIEPLSYDEAISHLIDETL